jgi:hypothetical protein
MKKQEEKINWFGEPQIKKKVNVNSNSINFLGMGTGMSANTNTHTVNKSNSVSFLGINTNTKRERIRRRHKTQKTSQRINFLGLNQSKNDKSNKMSPSSLFRKESIKKKKLSKWGDADLDGSPNYFDCDPRNAFKDAKNINTLKKAGKDFLKSFKKDKPYSPLEEGEKKSEKAAEKRKRTKEEYIKRMEELPERRQAPYKEIIAGIEEEEKGAEIRKGKISALKTRTERVKELLQKPGLAGTRATLKYSIEELQAAGKPPKAKDIAKLAKLERRTKKFGDIQQEGKLSREILTKLPGGEIGRVLSGAALDKSGSGEYSKATRAKAQKVRRMTEFASGAIFGNISGKRSFNSEPAARGRPPGPSGEYKIGGKPVYEEAFQQYAAKQNALNRLLPSGQQSQELNPEYLAYMKAKAAEDRGETQTVMTEEGMPMEGQPSAEVTGLPTTGTSMMQTGQQQIDMKERRAYVRATPDEIKMAQSQAQARDNVLMAPNFMKGELKATGGNILTPIGPSILEAPQVFKGEMRNVTKTNPDEGVVKLGERPQTNPTGDSWLDVEIGSGKPVIRKRITEKWMDGRAL